jgi:hypothetical protein
MTPKEFGEAYDRASPDIQQVVSDKIRAMPGAVRHVPAPIGQEAQPATDCRSCKEDEAVTATDSHLNIVGERKRLRPVLALAVGGTNNPRTRALVSPIAERESLPDLSEIRSSRHRQFESWFLIKRGHLISPVSVSRPGANGVVQRLHRCRENWRNINDLEVHMSTRNEAKYIFSPRPGEAQGNAGCFRKTVRSSRSG